MARYSAKTASENDTKFENRVNIKKLNYVDCEACTRLTIHIVQFQFIQETSRQQLGWTLPDTVKIRSRAPDDGRNTARNMYSRLRIVNESI
jgi:hypothetical protein